MPGSRREKFNAMLQLFLTIWSNTAEVYAGLYNLLRFLKEYRSGQMSAEDQPAAMLQVFFSSSVLLVVRPLRIFLFSTMFNAINRCGVDKKSKSSDDLFRDSRMDSLLPRSSRNPSLRLSSGNLPYVGQRSSEIISLYYSSGCILAHIICGEFFGLSQSRYDPDYLILEDRAYRISEIWIWLIVLSLSMQSIYEISLSFKALVDVFRNRPCCDRAAVSSCRLLRSSRGHSALANLTDGLVSPVAGENDLTKSYKKIIFVMKKDKSILSYQAYFHNNIFYTLALWVIALYAFASYVLLLEGGMCVYDPQSIWYTLLENFAWNPDDIQILFVANRSANLSFLNSSISNQCHFNQSFVRFRSIAPVSALLVGDGVSPDDRLVNALLCADILPDIPFRLTQLLKSYPNPLNNLFNLTNSSCLFLGMPMAPYRLVMPYAALSFLSWEVDQVYFAVSIAFIMVYVLTQLQRRIDKPRQFFNVDNPSCFDIYSFKFKLYAAQFVKKSLAPFHAFKNIFLLICCISMILFRKYGVLGKDKYNISVGDSCVGLLKTWLSMVGSSYGFQDLNPLAYPSNSTDPLVLQEEQCLLAWAVSWTFLLVAAPAVFIAICLYNLVGFCREESAKEPTLVIKNTDAASVSTFFQRPADGGSPEFFANNLNRR